MLLGLLVRSDLCSYSAQSGDQEVKYDMQILADRIEFCWIHLRGIRALENSLWGYDGQGVRVWLNALAIEAPQADDTSEVRDSVKESVNMPLDFYPLCEFSLSLC
jgi:RAB6A-GEF complex partner protein 1